MEKSCTNDSCFYKKGCGKSIFLEVKDAETLMEFMIDVAEFLCSINNIPPEGKASFFARLTRSIFTLEENILMEQGENPCYVRPHI